MRDGANNAAPLFLRQFYALQSLFPCRMATFRAVGGFDDKRDHNDAPRKIRRT